MLRMGRERHRVFVKSGVTVDTTEEILQRHFSAFGTVTDVYIPRSMPGPTPKGFAYVSFETEDAVQKAVKEAVHEIEGKHFPVGRAEPRPAERNTWHHEERNAMQITEPLLPWPPRYTRSLSPRGLLPGSQGGPPRLDMRSPLIPTPRVPLDVASMGDFALYLPRSSPSFADACGVDGRAGISRGIPDLPSDRISRSPRVFVGGLPDTVVERHIRMHFQKYGNVEDVYFPREKHTGKRRGFCFVRFDNPGTAHLAAAWSPRVIQGHEVGEIKVATERPEDFARDNPVEFGLDVDRHGRGPERGFGPEPGFGPERGYMQERGFGPEKGYERGYGQDRGYGPERVYGPDRGFGPDRGRNLERVSGHSVIPPFYEMPGQLPGELPRDLRGDFPGELPRDFPRQFHREFPRDIPRDFPGELPRDFPGDLPRDFPRNLRDFPGHFPGDFTRDMSREFPRTFDGRVPIRYRPY